MTATVLTRINQQLNMARFYKLAVQPSLFGGWSLVREWGRVGRGGAVRIETHSTRGNADLALIAKWAEKRKRGYH